MSFTKTMGDNATAPASASAPQGTARIRLADRADVGQIHRMVRELAEFMRLTHLDAATEELLASTLFPDPPLAPPFHTFTVLLLELHPSAFPPPDSTSSNPHFHPVLMPATLPEAASDPEASSFSPADGDGWVPAGYVLFFPNYASFQAEPGFFVENLFIRAPYRRAGLGKALLAAVANLANKMGMGGIDWFVPDWNKDAIRFCQGMGVDVMQGWYRCRLCGSELLAVGGNANGDRGTEEETDQGAEYKS